MLPIYVYITRPVRSSCRRLVYLAGEVAGEYPGQVEVVVDEKEEADISDGERPRPYIVIGDYVVGKNAGFAQIEKIVVEKLQENG